MNKCEWITDKSTGDLIMKCHDNKKRARVPKATIDATTSTADHSNIVIDKLKRNIEKDLNCMFKEGTSE